jgi:hypothetical protein
VNIDLDQLRLRIEERPRAVAAQDERLAGVRLFPRSDVPAWQCEIEWARLDGLTRASTGWSGPLDALENAVMIQLRAHELTQDKRKST